MAVDHSGHVYVADTDNDTIRVISAGTVSTVAGLAGNPGAVDSTNSAARFNGPSGVAVDGGGNLYVADTGNSTVRMITPVGLVKTIAGLAGTPGAADGTGSVARFNPCSAWRWTTLAIFTWATWATSPFANSCPAARPGPSAPSRVVLPPNSHAASTPPVRRPLQ